MKIRTISTKGVQLKTAAHCIDCDKYLPAGITVRIVFDDKAQELGHKCWRNCAPVPADVKNIQVIVDETAANSLEFLLALQKLGDLQRPAEGIYILQALQKPVMDLTAKYPSAVIKSEVV